MSEKKWIIKSKSPKSPKENFYMKETGSTIANDKINWMLLIILIVILILLTGFFIKRIRN